MAGIDLKRTVTGPTGAYSGLTEALGGWPRVSVGSGGQVANRRGVLS